MAQPMPRAPILIGAAALIALIALFLPWWTLSSSVSGFAGGASGSVNTAPFNDGSDDGSVAEGTVLTGIFWILGLVAAIGAVVLGFLHLRTPSWLPAALAGVAGLLFVLMPLLAIATWPKSGASFWGSGSGSGGGFGVTYSTYANVGWYLALVAGVGTAIGAFLSLRGLGAPASSAQAQPTVAAPQPVTPMVSLKEAPTGAKATTPEVAAPAARAAAPKKAAAKKTASKTSGPK